MPELVMVFMKEFAEAGEQVITGCADKYEVACLQALQFCPKVGYGLGGSGKNALIEHDNILKEKVSIKEDQLANEVTFINFYNNKSSRVACLLKRPGEAQREREREPYK